MKPYIFRIPSFNDNNINQFNYVANNPTIQPRVKVSILNVIILSGLVCLVMIGYATIGKMFITSQESMIGYISFAFFAPVWGSILVLLVIYNTIACCSHKQSMAILSMFINLLAGSMLLMLLHNLVGLVCALIVWGIAYNFYLGTKNRMQSVLKKDAGPYSALIIDNNKEQLLLENLNNNQLCCVDDLCEELKKLSKSKEK